MVALVFSLLILAMATHSSATWCVCKDGMSDPVLQKSLDYACGAGADCNPIHQNGACWNPNTVKAHCSYAVNSYFQRKSQAGATCDFSGSAAITTTDPSQSGCVYPASLSAAGTITTPSTNNSSPYSSTSIYGTGLGPSADMSHATGLVPQNSISLVSFTIIAISGLVLLWS